MSKNNSLIIAAVVVTLIIVIGGGSYVFSQMNLSNNEASNKLSTSRYNFMEGVDHSKMSMSISAMVKDDETFLAEMIPHHQEAIDTSRIIIAKSNDSELKQFAQTVINDQTKEIDQMKTWYKTFFNKDYAGTSTNMMGDLTKLSGTELDKAYVKGMIEHHQGAIDMANKILTLTQREEIKTLANNIISSQSKEISTLKTWMMSKYDDRSMMGM